MTTLHNGYKYAREFFSAENASSYDSVVHYATFGRDIVWKNQILKLAYGRTDILDLASGTGILSLLLARRRQANSRVISLDLTFEYLKIAKKKDNNNLFLVNGTAEVLPCRDESFDIVVSSYLAKYVNIEYVVKESWRTLKHQGIVIFHDFTYPRNSIMKKIWKVYFLFLKLIGKIIKHWAPVFKQLDKLIITTSGWPEGTVQCLRVNGFDEIHCNYHTLGTSAIIFARKP
jgi:demethylmenaquinone methyltransferase / 2-methoxy-6-polyprenyl-1,4-benzoquinol methylase